MSIELDVRRSEDRNAIEQIIYEGLQEAVEVKYVPERRELVCAIYGLSKQLGLKLEPTNQLYRNALGRMNRAQRHCDDVELSKTAQGGRFTQIWPYPIEPENI